MSDEARVPTWGSKTLVLVVSLAACLSVLENAARWLERHRARTPACPPLTLALVEANPTGSYRLKPGLDLIASVGGRRIPIRTNSHGMRWREVGLEKRAGVKRIAFLGDSFTFGCWSDTVEQSFVAVFESRIDRGRFEALNFGVGGYGLDDMELLLREQALLFAPDYVIVMFFDGNDFRDTYFGVNKYRIVDGAAHLNPDVVKQRIPEYTDESHPFVLAPTADPSAVRRWLRHWATVRLLFPALSRDNPWLAFRPSHYFTSFSYWSQFPYSERAAEARQVSLATLDRMRAFCAERGVRLLVAALPAREQVYSSSESGAYFDIGLPQAFVAAFAADKGIPFLDLLPVLRRHALDNGSQLYVPGDIHLNGLGHRLVGEALQRWFEHVDGEQEATLAHR